MLTTWEVQFASQVNILNQLADVREDTKATRHGVERVEDGIARVEDGVGRIEGAVEDIRAHVESRTPTQVRPIASLF